MKPLLFAFALVLCSPLFSAQAAAADGVVWSDESLKEALVTAAERRSLVMIDFFAEWCHPCKKFNREVFSRKDVAEALEGMITLRIDGESGEGLAVAERYHVVGFPTVLFLKADGTELDRIIGFMEANDFRATVGDYRSGRRTISALRNELVSKPADTALRYEVGKRLMIRGELDDALLVLKPLMEKGADFADSAEVHLVLGKYGYLRGKKDHIKAIEHLEIVLERYPKSKAAERATYSLARAHHQAGDTQRALAMFDRWIALAPKDPGRYNAVAWFCFENGVPLAKGARYARRAVEIDPKAAYAWDTLAEIIYAQGRPREAIETIKKAIRADPEDEYYQHQLKKFSLP